MSTSDYGWMARLRALMNAPENRSAGVSTPEGITLSFRPPAARLKTLYSNVRCDQCGNMAIWESNPPGPFVKNRAGVSSPDMICERGFRGD